MMADSGAIWTAGPAASPGSGRGWAWVEPTLVERSVMVTPDEWRVAVACHGPTSPQQLAVRTGMPVEHLQRVVETMAELGLLRLVEEGGAEVRAAAPRALGIVPEPVAEVAPEVAPPVPVAPPAPEVPAPSPLVFEAPGSTSGRPPRHAPAPTAPAPAGTGAPAARPRPRPEAGGPRLSGFERRVAKLEQRAQRADGDEDGFPQP